MARPFFPEKKRSNVPQQKIIPQFFTPRSGISKDEVNFSVKPANKVGRNSNLGFKETKTKQHHRRGSGGSGNDLYQITPPSGGFCSAKEFHRRFPKRSPVQQDERSFYNPTSAGSLNSQRAERQLSNLDADGTFHSVHFRDLYKQSGETHGSAMASCPTSSSSPSSATGSTSSLTSSRNKKKRPRKSPTKKPSLEGGKPPSKKRGRVPTISLDSANEDSDDDCFIVNVVSGTPVSDSKLQDGVDRSSRNQSKNRNGKVSNRQERDISSQSRSSVQINSRFGLFSDDVSESDSHSDLGDPDVTFASLPVEIMENIFCQLPVVDLMLNCVLVCHSWHDVISSESFIPWKKKYFRLKHGVASCEDEMVDLLDRKQLLQMDLFPVHLARFMNNFKGRRNVALLQNLSQHSKFHLIASFLKTLTPGSDKESSPWSVVSLLSLVSQTVYEVQEIVKCLVKSNACLVQDILECFYCLACIFFSLETQHRIGSGLHYKVFYSLYLFENAFQATRASLSGVFDQKEPGQQSLMRYRCLSDSLHLTHEQVRIIKHDVKEGEVIKIVAFAGTGKTTTLIEYTKTRPMEKFLNVAYNKSIQEHAEKSFPCNVESRTVHSLAYRAVGCRYRHKLAPAIRLSDIMDALPDKCGYLYARRVDDTLKNFIASTSSVVKAEHVPPVNSTAVVVSSESGDLVNSIFGEHGSDLSYLNSENHVEKVVLHAQSLWERMIDLTDKGIPITHDGYLKIYQLSRPVLSGYNCLLIDEAQDCTPAAADLLLKQRCAKILVGDPHQQIYAFRGARNALQEVAATHTFYLTQSFRFGPEIAYVAACVLGVLKGVRKKTLVGGSKPGSVLGDRKGQLCIITRCNYTLFNEAVNVCCSQNSTRVAFVGGIRGLALDRVLDIHKLFTAGTNNSNLGIKDNLIKKFRSFVDLKRFAKTASDFELLGKIKIVEAHNLMLEQRIEKIKSNTCRDMQLADIVFSTAHKAKGLEFETVRLTDDFLAGAETGISNYDAKEDEKNLVYVAVSRAKRCLQLTPTVLRILEAKKEYFLKVLSSKEANQDQVPPVCAKCMVATDVSPCPPQVVVQKEVVILGGVVRISGGILGPSCALEQMPHLGCLVNPMLGKVNQSESQSD